MARRACIALLLALIGCAVADAADLTKIERRLVKEPAYKSGSPRYALLVFGPEAKDRVWIVKDGDTLYVDRNGNGDLTDPGEKIAAKKGISVEDGYLFEVDEVTLGGKKHSNLRFALAPVKKSLYGEFAKGPEMKAALAKYPNGETLRIFADITVPHLKSKGQVTIMVGPFDIDGPLIMATKAADAPIIHLGGPLAVSFFLRAPSLRRERATDCVLVAGTPGLGSGTFAMIGYEGVIPDSIHPTAEITYPLVKAGSPPIKKLYELKKRC